MTVALLGFVFGSFVEFTVGSGLTSGAQSNFFKNSNTYTLLFKYISLSKSYVCARVLMCVCVCARVRFVMC
jgi:hypothetical protein